MKWLELKVPPLLVALIFAALIWGMPSSYEIINSIALYAFSWVLFFIGCLVAFLGVWEFKKQKTTVNPMSPEESNSLAIRGVYKYTRNPMYLGFLLWLLSLGIFLRNPFSLILLAGFVLYMNYFQIHPEERILANSFGEDYLEYKKSVRRWI
jgi:protein-S-isoprenylcysteine O-methyltransferase Ste14